MEEVKTSEQYGCTIVEHIDGKHKPLCVLGVLLTPRGIEIRDEMISVLSPYYHVYEVQQPEPGVLFEYPALRFMQELCLHQHQPCLYLHTKGAASNGSMQSRVRKMWYHEFLHCIDWYMQQTDTTYPVVACPFTGTGRQTWFNGFYVNEYAMASVNIEPNADRYHFESLFRDYPHVRIEARIDNDVSERKIPDMFHQVRTISQSV